MQGHLRGGVTEQFGQESQRQPMIDQLRGKGMAQAMGADMDVAVLSPPPQLIAHLVGREPVAPNC